jgi:hypothetical protein
MIFTESTIKISNNVSKMDSTIVLYRGDKNVEIRFTILQSPFKYSNTVATNIIESTNASYGQLVIKTPNDKPPIFSEVSATKEGTILFTITKEMIDEIEEVGVYTFQIRLMDENKQSRVTIPPVENGIEIKEPIAIEDDNTTNVVGLAKANYAVATLSDVNTPAFDDNGQYIKTNWNDGDIITNVSLNKIEDGIYTTNENVTATKKYVDNGINYNNKQFNNRIVAMNISKHPVSCSTEIYKKPLCDIFPELLNITYNTVFRDSNSFKVNMDNFAKEYPTVKSAYNKLNINLYDENDNSIGNSYGNSINGDGLNVIFINITESLRFYAYFDKALVDGSSTTMETKNGYMTIQLLIPKGNNKQEFIDKIKNLKLTLSVIRTDFLNLNNETIYTPTTDYNPATKKYVDDKITVKILPVDYNKNCATNVADLEPHSIYMSPNDAKFLYLGYEKLDGSFSGFVLSGNPHGKFIYTGAKDDTKIEVMLEGICHTAYFKTDTVDPHTEKTVFYLTKNNTTEFTPSNDYEPATKKYVDDNKIACTISSKVLGAVPASTLENFITTSDDRLLSPFSIANASINKDRRYFIEFLGSKKLCSLAISEKTGNSIACSIGNYNIQAFNSSTNIVINIEKINEDDTTFTDLVIYEEEVKYLDSKYLETDLVLQNSVSLGRVGNIGTGSSAVGGSVTASGMGSHAEGVFTIASGDTSHAEGESTTASGMSSHTEGNSTTASGKYAHAEGDTTTASGDYGSHAEGSNTIASGVGSHAEGNCTTASAYYSHAEGDSTTASGENSHAEGKYTTASGTSSHAEGDSTTASEYCSHAEGNCTTASGENSHAEGASTIASSQNQHVQGKYNIEDTNNIYAHIVGNGEDGKNSNAHTLDWEGNAWYSGKVTAGAAPVENMDLTTKKYVDDKVSSLPQISFNENGELVVTINGVSKTFVPKNV